MSNPQDRKSAREGNPVMAVWAEPFSARAPIVEMWREGMTVWEIVQSMKCLPKDFEQYGVVRINDHEVNPGAWHLVRPKGGTVTKPIAVTFHMPLRGGGGGGDNTGKMIVAVVAMIALTVLTAGMNVGLMAGLGGMFAAGGALGAGSAGMMILSASVGLLGSLAISALTRPPTVKPPASDNTESPESASAEGNVVSPNGSVSRVIGTRKVFPQLASEPLIALIGDDEYVEASYILNGPHAISNIKIGAASIDDVEEIESEILEGWPTDPQLTLCQRYGRANSIQLELTQHSLQASSETKLENQTKPDKSLPQWHRFATRRSPDEVWMQFILPGGLDNTADTVGQSIPLRLRLRKSGDSEWINCPEMHFWGNKQIPMRAQIIVHWDAETVPVLSGAFISDAIGWHRAFQRVPGQTALPVDPTTYQWEAHSHFYSGSGDRYVYTSNIATTGLINFFIDSNGGELTGKQKKDGGFDGRLQNTAHIYLDSASFPKGIYEIEVMRGMQIAASSLSEVSYIYAATNIKNFFKFVTTGSTTFTHSIHVSKASQIGALALSRVYSVWNEHLLPRPGFATISIKGKNKRLEALSCNAAGYVQDWNGTAWEGWTTTSNPAAHFRDVLVGRLNKDPLPLSLLDDDTLVSWRAHCTRMGYTADTIVSDVRVEDVLGLIAGLGFAKPYWSEIWGVVMDFDRTGQSPIQIFTPRNSRGFKFRKPFPRLPDGLLVSYRSDAEDESTQQLMVYREGQTPNENQLIEQVSYEGMIAESKITARATFDLRQGMYRSTFYSLEAPVEAIVCRRGSLVGVSHDILEYHVGGGRITAVTLVATDITAITIDAEIDLVNEPDLTSMADIMAVADMSLVGIQMGASIRRTNGTITTHKLSNVTGTTKILTLATPAYNYSHVGGPFDGGSVAEVAAGCLVAIGPFGNEIVRLLVLEVIPQADLTAQILMVDEAPELWAA